jgi:hypothetical protein
LTIERRRALPIAGAQNQDGELATQYESREMQGSGRETAAVRNAHEMPNKHQTAAASVAFISMEAEEKSGTKRSPSFAAR